MIKNRQMEDAFRTDMTHDLCTSYIDSKATLEKILLNFKIFSKIFCKENIYDVVI